MSDFVRRAIAYLWRGRVFVVASSQTRMGVWIHTGCPIEVGIGEAAAIGQAVVNCLRSSREGVDHPAQDQWKAVTAPLLDLAGVKRWSSLARGLKAVSIERSGNSVAFTPTRNLGPKQGILDSSSLQFEARPGNAEMGEDLLKAFEQSE